MSTVCPHTHLGWDPSFKGREALRWGVAAMVVLSLHVGAVAAAHLWQDPPPPPAEEAASAIMVDLAPLSVAPESIPDDMPDIVQTSMAAEPVDEAVEKVEPDTTPTTQPVTETVEATQETAEPVTEEALEPTEAEPVEQQVAETVNEVEEVIPDLEEAPLPEVAMALPSPRPEPVKEKPEPVQRKVTKPAQKKPAETVEKKKPQKPQSAQAASSVARADVAANAAAAPKPSQGARSTGDEEARWQTKVFRHLRGATRSVQIRRAAQVSFVLKVDAAGNISSASMVGSSGDAKSDAQLLDRIRKSSPIPAPPSGGRVLSAPFKLEVR